MTNTLSDYRARAAFDEEYAALVEQGHAPTLTIDPVTDLPVFRIELGDVHGEAAYMRITQDDDNRVFGGDLPQWVARIYAADTDIRIGEIPTCRDTAIGKVALVANTLVRDDVAWVAVYSLAGGDWERVLCPIDALGDFDAEAFYIGSQVKLGFSSPVIVLEKVAGHRIGCSTNSGRTVEELLEEGPHSQCEHRRGRLMASSI